MYRGFNLVVSESSSSFLDEYRGQTSARVASEADLATLRNRLDREQIDGDNVKESWFGGIPSQVFLSHSGKDRDLAYALADYLHAELNLEVFVDSRVWGGADRLLRSIDNLYCRTDDGERYDYEKRNYSTSHVHMMLSTALTEMIDQCECVIFLNTPKSIQAADAKQNASDRVASPWIYHELIMTKLIARHLRRPSSILSEEASLRAGVAANDRALEITYDAPLAHLKRLSLNNLQTWASQGHYGNAALDWLYRNHQPPLAEQALISGVTSKFKQRGGM